VSHFLIGEVIGSLRPCAFASLRLKMAFQSKWQLEPRN
jgi:hypothetical protein